MEDFSTIIWVVIFGAAMLFSAVSKKTRKQQSEGRENPHEAWPTLFGEPEEEPETQGAPHTAPDKHARTQQTDYSSMAEIVSETASDRLKSANKTQPEPANTTAPQIEAEETSAIADEFDLRKAVIYSEILKPKFEK